MTDKLPQVVTKLVFRVFADETGKVYLLYEPLNTRVEVGPPVNRATLDEAKTHLILLSSSQLTIAETAIAKPQNEKHADANREIEKALFPTRKGSFFARALYMFGVVFLGLLAALVLLVFTAVAYKSVQYSSENFPEWLHLVILILFAATLAYMVYLIATEENRLSDQARIKLWFGPRGFLVLPLMILLVAGSVFASFTFFLYKHGAVIMQPCAGRPVTEGSLMDFYMWHFLKLVPFLQITERLKWNEPLCYSQARIGALILLFQGFVVLPSINSIRFYWKNRQTLNTDYFEYIYDPEWTPSADVANTVPDIQD